MNPDKSEELEFINGVDQRAAGDTRSNAAFSTGTVGFLRRAHHPVAAFFHYFFKAVALFMYIFGELFSSNFVFICVACILLLAFDFWTVKNITGRLMVGLRWWSKVNENGVSTWVFESLENMNEVQAVDSQLFWIGIYAEPIIWIVLFFIAVLKFNIQWLVIVAVAITLGVANLIGYNKCSNDAKLKVRSFVQESAFAAMSNSGFRNMMFSMLNSSSGGGQQSS